MAGDTKTMALEKRKMYIKQQMEGTNFVRQIERALPAHLRKDYFIQVLWSAIRNNSKLAQCELTQLFSVAIQCAEIGLEPNTPKQHAYIIPFWNGKMKRFDPQLIVGYRGFIELATRAGILKALYWRNVYEGEEFVPIGGTNHGIKHIPLPPSDRGENLVASYFIATLDGGYQTEHFMWYDDIVKYHKNRTKSRDRDGNIVGPWKDDEPSMCLKTTIRDGFKIMPVSSDLLHRAIGLDVLHETDSPPIDWEPATDGSATVDSEVVDAGGDNGE